MAELIDKDQLMNDIYRLWSETDCIDRDELLDLISRADIIEEADDLISRDVAVHKMEQAMWRINKFGGEQAVNVIKRVPVSVPVKEGNA